METFCCQRILYIINVCILSIYIFNCKSHKGRSSCHMVEHMHVKDRSQVCFKTKPLSEHFFDFLFCFAQTSGGFRSFSVNDCCCTVQIHQPADKDNFSWQLNLRVFVAVSASIVWLLYLQWILCTSVEKIESGLLSWSST